MESTIKFPWFTPRKVKEVYREVVSEWENLHKESKVFTIHRNAIDNYFIVCEEGICFILSINKKGVLRRFDRGINDGFLLGLRMGRNIDCITKGGRFECQSFKELNDVIGVEDITDIQPHERGILRLKHQIDIPFIFIPKVVIRQWTVYREI